MRYGGQFCPRLLLFGLMIDMIDSFGPSFLYCGFMIDTISDSDRGSESISCTSILYWKSITKTRGVFVVVFVGLL